MHPQKEKGGLPDRDRTCDPHVAPHLQCLRLCVASDFLRDVYSAALEAKGLRVSQVESAPV
jgi:hypothetical protein